MYKKLWNNEFPFQLTYFGPICLLLISRRLSYNLKSFFLGSLPNTDAHWFVNMLVL